MPADLKAWRERHRLSIRAAAEAIGVAPGSIVNWEAGKYPIPKHIALACAAYSHGLPPIGS